MATEKDDKKDLGSKKINNQQQTNEGFSGKNLPKDYDPSKKLNTEAEKDQEGHENTVKRARSVDANTAPDVDESNHTTENGKSIKKNRGTSNESEDMETAENRDKNSDTEKNRYTNSNPESHRDRGNFDVNEK